MQLEMDGMGTISSMPRKRVESWTNENSSPMYSKATEHQRLRELYQISRKTGYKRVERFEEAWTSKASFAAEITTDAILSR